MEYVDIVDEQTAESLGSTAERREAHRVGLWHKVVHIWIVNSRGELLIQQRAASKEMYPNLWSMSCEGHVTAGQTSLQTAVTEVREELGLALSESDFELIDTRRATQHVPDRPEDHHFVDVFVVRKDLTVDKAALPADEVADVRWIDLQTYRAKLISKDPAFRHPSEGLDILDIIAARFS